VTQYNGFRQVFLAGLMRGFSHKKAQKNTAPITPFWNSFNHIKHRNHKRKVIGSRHTPPNYILFFFVPSVNFVVP
jgi:hypothetical protein